MISRPATTASTRSRISACPAVAHSHNTTAATTMRMLPLCPVSTAVAVSRSRSRLRSECMANADPPRAAIFAGLGMDLEAPVEPQQRKALEPGAEPNAGRAAQLREIDVRHFQEHVAGVEEGHDLRVADRHAELGVQQNEAVAVLRKAVADRIRPAERVERKPARSRIA